MSLLADMRVALPHPKGYMSICVGQVTLDKPFLISTPYTLHNISITEIITWKFKKCAINSMNSELCPLYRSQNFFFKNLQTNAQKSPIEEQ